MKEHIFITGGAGYLGSVLVRRLLESGYRVTVLDNFLFNQTSLLDCAVFEDLRIVRGDCRDEALVRELARSADIVIPMAALVGAPLCDRDKTAAVTTNRDAVRMICRITSREQRIILPVTNSGYGIGEKDKFCTEESPLRPISLYGITKMEAEMAALERGNAITFRFATVFGVSPRMRLDLLVNDFTWRAVNDRAVVVFEGHFKRNFIHIDDIARVFLHGTNNFESMKNRPYNVGLEDANLSKLELCAEIKKVVSNFTWLEAQVGEDVDKRDYIVSNKRLLSTGFKPEWSLERGIRQLTAFFPVLRRNFNANV